MIDVAMLKRALTLLLFAFLAFPAVVPAGQVPCPKVLSELTKMRRSEDELIHAMEKVAKKLDTSPIWVENCMRIYGRTVPRKVAIDLEQREDLAEHMEETEPAPEDLAPEDVGEPDEPELPERDTAGTSKRKAGEYLEYEPQ